MWRRRSSVLSLFLCISGSKNTKIQEKPYLRRPFERISLGSVMGTMSTNSGHSVRARLEYLARETALEAPEISAVLLALAAEPAEAEEEMVRVRTHQVVSVPQIDVIKEETKG